MSRPPPDPATILAVASAPGRAPVAIVRASGARAVTTAERLIASGALPRSWRAADLRLAIDGVPVSVPALAYVFTRPRSFTREDVVEFHLPGAGAIVAALVATWLARGRAEGVRLAHPGEFTRRALEHGRIGVTEVAALGALVAARNAAEARAATRLLAGGISAEVRRLRGLCLDLAARIEAELDFVDEEIDVLPRAAIAAALEGIARELAGHAATLAVRPSLAAAPVVVLAGPTNAGKSSLFNALVGAEVAVTGAEPGTTRDPLVARLGDGASLVDVVDSAGLDGGVSSLDARAVARAREAVRTADLVLWVTPVDAVQAPPHDLESARTLWVVTKLDLAPQAWLPAGALGVSVRSGQGLDELARRITATATAGESFAGFAADANLRGEVAAAHAALIAAHAALDSGREVVALELAVAIDALGRVLGEGVGEAILDRIFARFCIGK